MILTKDIPNISKYDITFNKDNHDIIKYINSLTLDNKKNTINELLFNYKNGNINTFLILVFKQQKLILEDASEFITDKFQNILHLVLYHNYKIDDLLYYTIILYNISINGYKYEYLSECIGGTQCVNRYIYDLIELFNVTYVKKNNYSILKMLKSGKYPENIYYQKNIKINSYISYNFLSNEEYIIKFKEYYITKYDIDIISKNYEIIKERNKNLENNLNDLKNEIVRLKNYNTILLNKITDLENFDVFFLETFIISFLIFSGSIILLLSNFLSSNNS